MRSAIGTKHEEAVFYLQHPEVVMDSTESTVGLSGARSIVDQSIEPAMLIASSGDGRPASEFQLA